MSLAYRLVEYNFKYMKKVLSIILGLCLFTSSNYTNSFESINYKISTINFNNKPILKVKIADTENKLQIGLMYVKKLAPNEGMLFVFDKVDKHCFWMKNTYIPLDIAFIDENKTIVDIQSMQSLSLETHCPKYNKIKYALEVNKNWFKNNLIKINSKLNFNF